MMNSPNQHSSLRDWLHWIENQHPVSIDLTLDRIQSVGHSMNLLNPSATIITVAGTNGKGSCCALLEAILIARGLKVGLYTSPHLNCYNERIRIQGQNVSDADLCQAFFEIEQHINKDNTLTYFEYGTLAALYFFAKTSLDILILEVGMGGRLDAVNCIESDISVITSIDLDHQQWLGTTREAIAKEKAGIFRKAKPAVCGDPNMPITIKQVAKEVGAILYTIEKDFSYQADGQGWNWMNADINYSCLPLPPIHLQNAATALMVVSLLTQFAIDRKSIEKGLLNLKLIGRQDLRPGNPPILFDVAHNNQALIYLANCLQKIIHSPIYAVVSILNDKDCNEGLRQLFPYVEEWFIAGLAVTRGANALQLAQQIKQLGAKNVYAYHTVKEAFQSAINKIPPNGLITVFGSFYTVAEAMAAHDEIK